MLVAIGFCDACRSNRHNNCEPDKAARETLPHGDILFDAECLCRCSEPLTNAEQYSLRRFLDSMKEE